MRKKTGPTVLGTAIALTLAAAPLSAADRIRAGQWEFSTTRAKGEAILSKHCITADEAASANGDANTARAYTEKQAAGRCKVTDYKVAGASVSYAMTCGPRSIRATATYHGDTFEGDQFTKDEGGPEIVSHVKARRVGNCP